MATQKQLAALRKGRAVLAAKRKSCGKNTTTKRRTTTKRIGKGLRGVENAKPNIQSALREAQQVKHLLFDSSNPKLTDDRLREICQIAADRIENIEGYLQVAVVSI